MYILLGFIFSCEILYCVICAFDLNAPLPPGFQWVANPKLINFNFTTHILWTRFAKNVGICGSHCWNDEQCLSFIYYHGQNTCQGHNHGNLSTKVHSFEVKADTKYYVSNRLFKLDITGMLVNQSSDYSGNSLAHLANDGSTNRNPGFCAHTRLLSEDPLQYWAVYFGYPVNVRYVRIYTRSDASLNYYSNIEVSVGNELSLMFPCGGTGTQANVPTFVDVACTGLGSIVKIVGKTGVRLSLCEVEIFAV